MNRCQRQGIVDGRAFDGFAPLHLLPARFYPFPSGGSPLAIGAFSDLLFHLGK
jgi:hypothetical protein